MKATLIIILVLIVFSSASYVIVEAWWYDPLVGATLSGIFGVVGLSLLDSY